MNIADIKKYKSLDIAKLVKAPWNYKEEDSKLSEKLVANIKRNGQVENLIVRKLDTGCYEIVNGNHRYDALVAIGAKKAIVHDLGVISEVEAKRIAIETNETRFLTDKTKLSDLMDEIVKEFDMEDVLASMPFSEAELVNLISIGDVIEEGAPSDASNTHRDSAVPFIVEGDRIELVVCDATYLKELLLKYENRCEQSGRLFQCEIVQSRASNKKKARKTKPTQGRVESNDLYEHRLVIEDEEDPLL